MDIFSVHDSQSTFTDNKVKRTKKQKTARTGERPVIKHEKPQYSKSQVLDKIEKLKATAEAAKGKDAPVRKAPSASTEMFASIEKKGKPLKPGELSNDPSDPATADKLKNALNFSTINFNGKEKEVLAKILNS